MRIKRLTVSTFNTTYILIIFLFWILWCTWGAVVGREPKFEMTSEVLWLTSPQIQPSEDRIQSSLDRILLGIFWLAKTEFDLRKAESEVTSLRGLLTSSQISVHVQLLHPKCITGSRKVITTNTKFEPHKKWWFLKIEIRKKKLIKYNQLINIL